MTLALLTDPWTYLEYALICIAPMLVLAGCASCVLLQDSLRRARRKHVRAGRRRQRREQRSRAQEQGKQD